MSKKLVLITTMALVLAGCGDNDVATSGEPATLDKAMDSTGDAANAVKDTTSDVVESAGDMPAVSDSTSSGGAGDIASDAKDTASEIVHDADQGSADTTRLEGMTTEEAQEYMDKEMEKLGGEIGQ